MSSVGAARLAALLGLGLGLGVLLTGRSAAACTPNFCWNVPRWPNLDLRSSSPIPTDGALVFHGRASHHECIELIEPHIKVDVRRDGSAIAGTTSLAPGFPGLIVWRPDAPLAASAKYEAHVEIDNDAIMDDPFPDEPQCGPPKLTADFTVETATSASEALAAPVLTGEMTVKTRSVQDLATLACCPGVAAGYQVVDSCGGEGISWDREQPALGCAFVHERTSMEFRASGEHPLPAPLAGQTIYRILVDDEVRYRGLEPSVYAYVYDDEPFCAVLQVEHLGTGERTSSAPRCFGEELVGQLGVHPADVLGKLACEPQICEVIDDSLDTSACVAFDPEQPPTLTPAPAPVDPEPVCPGGLKTEEEGCGCRQGAGAGAAWGLLLLALVGRRRG